MYIDQVHSVRADADSCARAAAEHLTACGYRRLAYLDCTDGTAAVSKAISLAFNRTVVSLGCPAPMHAVFNSNDFDDPDRSMVARQVLSQWIQKQDKPIGLYIQDMSTARYLTQICAQMNLRIPEDVGMVVHGADKLTATSITPTLSEIMVDYWEQGYQAAAVLDKLMRGKRVDPRCRYIKNPRIITRESSDQFISEDELVSRAMRMIAEKCRQPISAENIADAMEVSRRTLDRRFDDVVGKTVNQEIVCKRLEQIQVMLIESDLSMTGLTELFGFSSASQFTQYFKKHAGVTPSAFRQQSRPKA